LVSNGSVPARPEEISRPRIFAHPPRARDCDFRRIFSGPTARGLSPLVRPVYSRPDPLRALQWRHDFFSATRVRSWNMEPSLSFPVFSRPAQLARMAHRHDVVPFFLIQKPMATLASISNAPSGFFLHWTLGYRLPQGSRPPTGETVCLLCSFRHRQDAPPLSSVLSS